MALISRVTDLINLVLSGARFIVSERSPLSDYLVFANATSTGSTFVDTNTAFVAGVARKARGIQRLHGLISMCAAKSQRNALHREDAVANPRTEYQTRTYAFSKTHTWKWRSSRLATRQAARCRGAPESSLAIDDPVQRARRTGRPANHPRSARRHYSRGAILAPIHVFQSKTLDRLTLSNMDCNGVVA